MPNWGISPEREAQARKEWAEKNNHGRKTNTDNRVAVCPADTQSVASDAPLEAKKTTRFTSRVNVVVHSVRKRLADPDGISVKAELDSIVAAGILRDDSCAEIEEVRFTQEKTKGEEKTIITITEI